MNTKHIISVVTVTALILPTFAFAQDAGSAGSGATSSNAREIKERREAGSGLPTGKRMGTSSTTTREERNAAREIRKDERAADRAVRIKERIGHIIKKMEERIAKMTENQNKIEAHLNRFADRGVDVSASRAELAKGRATLAEASTALAAVKAKLATITLDGSAKDAARMMRGDLDAVRTKIKIAHDSTMNSIRNLRAKVGETRKDPKVKATTTSTTTQ